MVGEAPKQQQVDAKKTTPKKDQVKQSPKQQQQKKKDQAPKPQPIVKQPIVEEEEDEDEEEQYEEEEQQVVQAPKQPAYKKPEVELTPEEIAYLPPSRKPTLDQFLPQQMQQQQQQQHKSWNAPVQQQQQVPVFAASKPGQSLLDIQKAQALEAKKQKKEHKKEIAEFEQKTAHPWGSSAAPIQNAAPLALIQAEQKKKELELEQKARAQKQAVLPTAWGSSGVSAKSLEEIQREQKKNKAQQQQQQQLTLQQQSAEKPVNVVAPKKESAPAVKSAWANAAPVQAQPLFQSAQPQAKATKAAPSKPAAPVAQAAPKQQQQAANNDEDDEYFWSQNDTRYDEEEEEEAPAPAPAPQQQPIVDAKNKKNKKVDPNVPSYKTAIAGQRAPQVAPSVFDKGDFPTLKVAPAKEPKAQPAPQQKKESGTVPVSNDFKEWYRRGLEGLGKKYESSLMFFFLAQPEDEIDLILTEYVGASAAAREFIDEFKRFRSFELGGQKKSQQQQPAVAQSKKKKKQQAKQEKKIDPSLLGFNVAKRPSMVQSADEIDE